MKTKVVNYINPYEASKEDEERSDEDFDFALVRFLVTEFDEDKLHLEMFLEEHIPLEEGKTKADYIAAAWVLAKAQVETEAVEIEKRKVELAKGLAAVESERDEVDGSDIDPETGEVIVVEEEEED